MHKALEFFHKGQASEKTEKNFKNSTFKVPGLGARVLPLGSRVLGPRFHLEDGYWVLGLESHQHSRVSGPTFWKCRFTTSQKQIENMIKFWKWEHAEKRTLEQRESIRKVNYHSSYGLIWFV